MACLRRSLFLLPERRLAPAHFSINTSASTGSGISLSTASPSLLANCSCDIRVSPAKRSSLLWTFVSSDRSFSPSTERSNRSHEVLACHAPSPSSLGVAKTMDERSATNSPVSVSKSGRRRKTLASILPRTAVCCSDSSLSESEDDDTGVAVFHSRMMSRSARACSRGSSTPSLPPPPPPPLPLLLFPSLGYPRMAAASACLRCVEEGAITRRRAHSPQSSRLTNSKPTLRRISASFALRSSHEST
mmetsp:Transcript_1638/g.6004  ORF Transcript_1638/g.6004 Transcript_1638/m.6004 type:complete len:246 (+) Transcript_1638:758-1495(+)